MEVKSFLGASETYEFHKAFGQYVTYKEALDESEPNRKLFLALPKKLKKGILRFSFIQNLLSKFGVYFCIFDPVTEEIIEWKD